MRGRAASRKLTPDYLDRTTLRPSRPSRGVFIPWDEAAEQRVGADRGTLVEAVGLLDDMVVRTDAHVFPNGVVGIIVTYDMLERERSGANR